MAERETQRTLRQRSEWLLRRFFHLYWRFSRGMTLGVRAVVVDERRHVFLVRHSYVAGWHLPGGGVEVGQTVGDALARELMEEGCIRLLGPPVLHGVFHNAHVSVRDHVAVYVVHDFVQERVPAPNREIVASGFYALDALPPETTAGTRHRIAEVIGGAPPMPTWIAR